MIYWIALLLSLFIVLICFIMFRVHTLNKTVRKIVSKYGLIHFTTEAAANKIISTSVIKAGANDHRTYFFQNGTVAMDAISYNKLKNKKVGIEILNLTEQQLSHLKIRYYDMAIVYKGDFLFSEENQVSVKTSLNISPVCTNLFLYNRIARIMLIVGTAFIILLLTLKEYL